LYDGAWYVYACTATLPSPVTITESLSMGWVVDNSWGEVAPYNGISYTAIQDVAGCEGYRDGDYWGDPRWTPLSEYFGDIADMAYALGYNTVSSEASPWDKIKSMYR